MKLGRRLEWAWTCLVQKLGPKLCNISSFRKASFERKIWLSICLIFGEYKDENLMDKIIEA